jgi:patatin-like phospholipase/acyl hydrolase
MSFKDKLDKNGPRKLLALEGGGIRGIITIEVLSRIETLLEQALGRDDTFVLSEYFDYIAGTSTGAIIATCLSLGKRIDWIRNFYLRSGKEMFDPDFWRQLYYTKYKHDKLASLLQDEIGEDTKLGSEKLETLLLLIMRNATTDSPWPISNNPRAKYNNPQHPDCNLEFPLWKLVRASTAAPTYFPPELIEVGEKKFIFVDGGVTMYNNPAFQLFLMATVEPYQLEWPASEKDMLLVSIGTGASASANANLKVEDLNLIYNMRSIPSALMYAAQVEQDFLCRVFGKCVFGSQIDREVGTMIGKHGPVEPKLFTYMRYNADISRQGLNDLHLLNVKPEDVQKLDSVNHINEIQLVGKAVAEQVRLDHFAGFLQ